MNMARTALVGMVAAALIGLTACGGGVADTGQVKGPEGGGTQSKVYDQIQSLPKAQMRAKAVELAKKEGTFVLYTSLTQDAADEIVKRFTDQFGIKVQVFRGNSETVLQRVMQEAQAGRLGADVVESNFLELERLQQQSLSIDYKGSGLDKVVPTAKFKGWTATRFNIFLPAWNTNLIKPGEEPKSWEDLAHPRFKGKIALELSDSDWYENVTRYWRTQGKTQAQVDDLWRRIAANSKVTKGHTTMMELLGAGQMAMHGMNYSYITERAKQEGAPVDYRGPDGTTSVPAFPRPNGVAALKAAKHPASAWLFYDWLLNEGQKIFVELHFTPSTKVPGDKSLQGIKLSTFDVETLSKEANRWQADYDRLLRGRQQIG